MRFRHKRLIGVATLFVTALTLQMGAAANVRQVHFPLTPRPSVTWNNPHHAYVVFQDPANRTYWYIKEISVDAKPSPTLVLGGNQTGFCTLSALAIGPQGNLYVTGTFGTKCRTGIEIFSPGASGNVAPIARIMGSRTRLRGPDGMAFDSTGKLYVADNGGCASRLGSINVYPSGAIGNIAPVARIAGSKTLMGDCQPAFVAVDNSGETFVGQGTGQVLKFAAAANGNVAPLANNTVNSGNGFCELQSSGGTVYAAIGILRSETPTVYELSTADLSQTGGLTDHRFTTICADADSAGKIYVEDVIRSRGDYGLSRLFEYEPGAQQPYRVRAEGTTFTGGYVVVGP